jgi:predicted GNAT superfamily acetyltransferase
MSAEITIRSCHELAEFHACVALQREIWGEEPLEVEPATMFVVAANSGGQVIGAFAGDVLIGFILAVAGVRDGRPYLHSHMAAVRDDYRNQGLGRKLKLFQREEALQRGIQLIEWTFDPLEVRNAHFNLNRLGAVCRKYLPNLYGVTTSPLHRGLRTDRLLAEWYLESEKVIAAVDGLVAGPVNPEASGLNIPGIDSMRISVPSEVPYGLGGDVSSVTSLQNRLRDEFTERFANGFHAVAIDTSGEPSYILLRPQRTLLRGS